MFGPTQQPVSSRRLFFKRFSGYEWDIKNKNSLIGSYGTDLPYICIENRWTFTGVFGVATAQLCPQLFNSPRDDFLHEGVGCLPVAQVTVASDANKFHHILHRPRHTVV